jgi:DNA repair exonuclease SbcCD nuclease subunit
MKVAVVTDTHFGVKNDSPLFLDEFLSFFEKQFFPYILENNITTVLHLGDLLDRRKFVNFYTLAQVRDRFMSFFEENNITLHIILGNHDTFYRNTSSINSMTELFSHYKNIHIYDEPVVVDLDGFDLNLVPWINEENVDKCIKFLEDARGSVVMGHFEINGFQVVSGVKHSHGMEPSLFNKFDAVYSGHFHIKQNDGNITYLGTPYQITFSDAYDTKGFHIFDTEDASMTFIPNERKIFYVLTYDDKTEDPLKALDASKYKNCYVKIIVLNKTKPYTYDRFVESIYAAQPVSVTFIEEVIEISKEDIVDTTEDTITIINKEIDAMEEVDDKSKLKKIVQELYMESLTL